MENLVLVLKAVFLLLACIGAIYYIASTIALVAHFQGSDKKSKHLEDLPAVSVLKPVCGLDSDAAINLRSFLDQDYPNYEVLFGVLDKGDEAVELIRSIEDESARAKVFIGSDIAGANNKVQILHNLLQHSTGEIIIVSDAETRVTSDWLRRMVSEFCDSRVGGVTCMYRGVKPKGPADILEGLYMTCVFAPGVACSRFLQRIQFALGATTAVTRTALMKIGGFEPFANFLADDYQLGYRIANAGYDMVLSDYVVDIALSGEGLASVLERELRWSRTTRISRPAGHFGLIFTFGFAYAVSLSILAGFSKLALSVLIGITIIRLITALFASVVCLQEREIVKRIMLLPVRDLLCFWIWIASYCSNTIKWRGRSLHVRSDGTMIVAE